MSDWSSTVGTVDEDGAWGQEAAVSGRLTGRGTNSYMKVAGWALGKVMRKEKQAPDDESLAACRIVSEEFAVRAGFFPREAGAEEGARRKVTDSGAERGHCFFGNSGGAAGQRAASSSGARGKRAGPTLGDYDPSERGEGGVAPLLRGDFYRLVNVAAYEAGTFPKHCTATAFSTTWSASHQDNWRLMMKVAQSRHSEGSLVDFSWSRVSDPNASAEGGMSVVCCSLPVDFEQDRGHGGLKEGWKMVIGVETSGTCFRSARLVHRPDAWRANAIANLFLCPVQRGGAVALNVVRHGVVGYSKEPIEHVSVQLELCLRHIIQAQMKEGKPMRVVSVNMLSHYKASGEPEMTERQLALFRETVRRVNARHLMSEDVSKGGFPRDLPQVQYEQLLLPGNTDQWEMGADYNRRSNVQCMLTYLEWVTHDLVCTLKRFMVPLSTSLDDIMSGPGGCYKGASAAGGHWVKINQSDTEEIRKSIVGGGGALDKASIVDAVTWADFRVDRAFKTILLLPIVASNDDCVWETLCAVFPEYLQKRLELHRRSLRQESDLGPESIRGSDSTRHTVFLIRHMLHIVSSLACLAYGKLAAFEQNLAKKSKGFKTPSKGGSGVGAEKDDSLVDGGDDDDDDPSEVGQEGRLGRGPSTPPSDVSADVSWTGSADDKTAQALSCKALLSAVWSHKREVERARIAANLLRTLVQAELGVWEGGYSSSSVSIPGSEVSGEEGEGGKRKYSRATSMNVAALLHQSLGVAVFINCKSGLDRSGLQTAVQSSVSSLWSLYPSQRWALHLAVINSHLFQGRNSLGDESYSQPVSMDSFSTQQEAQMWFRSLLKERSIVRAHRLGESPGARGDNMGDRDAAGWMSEGAKRGAKEGGAKCDDVLLFDDNSRMLRALFPLQCCLRNFVLAYLCEANAVVTFGSTGVRGMKYEGHPLIGALIPREVRVASERFAGGGGSGEEYRIMALSSKQYLGLKGLAGGKLAQECLSDLGRTLLVDASRYRCS